MSKEDWVKKYAAMDKRIAVKYEQLPKGEQVAKKPAPKQEANKSSQF
jgi:hypothetical protein